MHQLRSRGEFMAGRQRDPQREDPAYFAYRHETLNEEELTKILGPQRAEPAENKVDLQTPLPIE